MAALRRDATLIVIAHKLDTITAADQIVVLDETGRVAQIGTHADLYSQAERPVPGLLGRAQAGMRGGGSSDGYHGARPGPQREAGPQCD